MSIVFILLGFVFLRISEVDSLFVSFIGRKFMTCLYAMLSFWYTRQIECICSLLCKTIRPCVIKNGTFCIICQFLNDTESYVTLMVIRQQVLDGFSATLLMSTDCYRCYLPLGLHSTHYSPLFAELSIYFQLYQGN